MRRIDTGGAVILLFCMVLLGGCAAGNETAAESAAPQISLPSQSEEAEYESAEGGQIKVTADSE